MSRSWVNPSPSPSPSAEKEREVRKRRMEECSPSSACIWFFNFVRGSLLPNESQVDTQYQRKVRMGRRNSHPVCPSSSPFLPTSAWRLEVFKSPPESPLSPSRNASIHPGRKEGRDVKGRDTNNNIRIEKQDKQQQQERRDARKRVMPKTLLFDTWGDLMMGRLERLYQSHHQSLTPPFVFLFLLFSFSHLTSHTLSYSLIQSYSHTVIHTSVAFHSPSSPPIPFCDYPSLSPLSRHTVQTYWTQNLRMRDGLLVFLFSSKCFFLFSVQKFRQNSWAAEKNK